MEHGDLALTVRPRYVLVLEGVLADVTPITQSRRLRRDRRTGYNIHWYDLPLRRLATMKRQFPDVGAEIVTFISEEVIDIASDFLDVTSIPYDSLSYADFHSWISHAPVPGRAASGVRLR